MGDDGVLGTTLNSLPILTDDGTNWNQAAQQPQQPQSGGGYWLPQIARGLWNTAKSGFTLPGDVATGKASMADPATQARVGDMASLATMGMGGNDFGPRTATGFNVYHGSPNPNIDAMSSSAIGSGEGTQMEGHGLYFSESPSYAKSYAGSKGALYNVDINANPEHFLDWNAPMRQQSWPAYRAAKNLDALPAASGREVYNNLLTRMSPSEASAALQAQGVPGIRQPMFRSNQSNYVLFNDNLAKIRNRAPVQ